MEKRLYPRVKRRARVKLPGAGEGDSWDMSERGLRLCTSEVISSPDITLQISFPDKKLQLKTKAKLIWRRDLQEGTFLYGVEFVSLGEQEKAVLRRELIESQISGMLNEIKNPEIRRGIQAFFLNDVLGYVNEITRLISLAARAQGYSEELEKKLEQLNHRILLKGHCLELLLSDAAVIQRVKDNFRHIVGTWIYKSGILKGAFDRPRGDRGAYKILEAIYDNRPLSQHIGAYLDNNFLKSPYAVAVRRRKDRMRELIGKFICEAKEPKIRILNVGCGSCRELRELLPRLTASNFVIITCLDWDEEALRFSHDLLLPLAPKNVELLFIKEDVTRIIKGRDSRQRYGSQNLIYSAGLFDLLPDRALKKLLLVLYSFLLKGGRLVLTHQNREKTIPPIGPSWFCGLRFVARTADEVTKLIYACGISNFSLSVESDDFGYMYYFTIGKKGV